MRTEPPVRPSRLLRRLAKTRRIPRYYDEVRLTERDPRRYIIGYDEVPKDPRNPAPPRRYSDLRKPIRIC